MATAKTNMPGPVDFDLKMAAMVEPGLTGFVSWVMDSQPGQQMAQEAHARAIDVAVQMENESTQIDAATPEFQPVPVVISPSQRGTLSPMLRDSLADPLLPTSTSAPVAASPFLVAERPSTAGGGGAVGSTSTQAQPPVAGVPAGNQQPVPGSGGTVTSGYQPPPAPNPAYQPAGPTPYQPPVTTVPDPNSGGGPAWSPPGPGWGPGSAIDTTPSSTTTSSGYPGLSWPGGGGLGQVGGDTPQGVADLPDNSFGGGGFGGTGDESIRAYQPGAISSRLGSGSTGAGGNSGGGSGGAVGAEREAAGGAPLGSAAGRTSQEPGMPGGSGGGKRKEEDKEHKSAGYVHGDDLFEPLGGELPPSVIGERRSKSKSSK
jgi:hypothetical protein